MSAAATPLVSHYGKCLPPPTPLVEISGAGARDSADELPPREVRYMLQDTAVKLLPGGHRVGVCMRLLGFGHADVGVSYSPSRGRARYRRLATCGCVWGCPVCAEHITEGRADEIRRALARNDELGGSAAFLTFTVSHKHEDGLEAVLEGFLAAFRYLTSKPSYKRLRDRWDVRGLIRVLEVTYGRNGWHVHVHALCLFRGEVADEHLDNNAGEFKRQLHGLWSAAAGRFGLSMDFKHGLEVRPAYGSVEDYLQKFGRLPKWDVARELAKGHVKRGRSVAGLKHLTPWELLAAAHNGDRRCGELFAEYVARFEGKAQVYWSRGLKAELLPDEPELTDAELAERPEDDEVEVGAIDRRTWNLLVREGARGRPLALIEESAGDWAAVRAYLDELRGRYPPPVAWSG